MSQYIIITESNHEWIVSAKDAGAAESEWDRVAEAGDAECRRGHARKIDMRIAEDRERVEYLRLMGNVG